ncbi:MAG: universal stress protein, partial [Hyphococcus sp.]
YGNYHVLRRAGATDVELQKYIKEEEDAVRPRARNIIKSAGPQPADIVLKPALFNPYDPVLEAAAEKSADLIVVGTNRKQAFERFRLGSVSEAILRRADVDVLVVPPSG